MATPLTIGILAFHGDVAEHADALLRAAYKLKLTIDIREVRTKGDLKGLHGLIIPGGESTTMHKLAVLAGMFEGMKKVPNIFGTCAGAILLASHVRHAIAGQKTLSLMDMDIDRNAYGTQKDSFESMVSTELGSLNAVFIRGPKIVSVGKNVAILARQGGEVLACEAHVGSHYYLATCFHPEFTSTIFHEHFLKQILASVKAK